MTKIRDLEAATMGVDATREGVSGLGDWYAGIRDREIGELEDDDLCRACRQGLFPDVFVPATLRRLEGEPLAGDMYDGEMLGSLVGVSRRYWDRSHDSRKTVRRILAQTRDDLDEDMAADIAKLEKLVAEP